MITDKTNETIIELASEKSFIIPDVGIAAITLLDLQIILSKITKTDN